MGSTQIKPAQDLTFRPRKPLLLDFVPEKQGILAAFRVASFQIRQKRVKNTFPVTALVVLRTRCRIEVSANSLGMKVQKTSNLPDCMTCLAQALDRGVTCLFLLSARLPSRLFGLDSSKDTTPGR